MGREKNIVSRLQENAGRFSKSQELTADAPPANGASPGWKDRIMVRAPEPTWYYRHGYSQEIATCA
jgi:hypothetical protein